ncbi:hypothetical protein ETAA8_60970 [Anatilimnocola aggregata]|uniref:Uncharacterized protein n=1 Tax=Anatilimnocola aggregata TaxID=2528021 RepID=A0A517YL62_9BACT|nr:hypothetical protein [Anatilimnocola aggregata]QDU30944.1 hypothetical protein ETAA8_60970 [Anatilimnocola aggregata]
MRHWHLCIAFGGLALAPLVTPFQLGNAEERVYRSVADLRPRMWDELHQSRYTERWTHRGVELFNDHMNIVCGTNLQDARRAAAEATRAWKDAGDLADQFTKVHRERSFGIGVLQIVIDKEPLRDRDAPLTTLNVVGLKSQITLHVTPGGPTLDQQAERLREATVLAFLRTTELDVQYPDWVAEGIAGYLAQRGESEDALARVAPKPTTANIGGQQWRAIREKPDVLTPAADVRAESIARIKFLLEGEDSSHAPAFFAMLRASAQDVARRRPGEGLVKTSQGEVQPSFAGDEGNRLFAQLEPQFVSWQREPLAGQPIYRPASNISPEMEMLQREMILALKLLQRQTVPEQVSVNTKVVVFKQDEAPVAKADSGKQLAIADPQRAFDEFVNGDQQPWATRDIDGSLLLSSNLPRLAQLFGEDGRRFHRIRQNDHWVLAIKLGKGRTLTAWLEESDETPLRPEARFAIVDPSKPAANMPAPPPAAQPQAELGAPVVAPQPQQATARANSAPPGDQPVGQWRAKAIEPNK